MTVKLPGLKTKIFLDSGNPQETKEVKAALGWLDGQTTNPTLIARNPQLQLQAKKQRMSGQELENYYRQIIQKIDKIIPGGAISVEVYANFDTSADAMVEQARRFAGWAKNVYIKLPIIPAGLKAAQVLLAEGIKVNMTLCFSQAQAAAVYAATQGAQSGAVFISPFIGRLDDQRLNGFELVLNIKQMFASGDSHVQILAASVRSLDHLLAVLQNEIDAVTAPAKVLMQWARKGVQLPVNNFVYQPYLQDIPYQQYDLSADWRSFPLEHPLTKAGIEKFADDWNSLINI